MEKQKPVYKVREVLSKAEAPVTLKQISMMLPDLKASQISCALWHFTFKLKIVMRVEVDNTTPKKRKKVWAYIMIKSDVPKLPESQND